MAVMTEQAQPPRRRARAPRGRSRTSHSIDAVIAGAIEILDESGSQGLTTRALATRLGGGPASIYWYVSGREELLDLAADSVLGGVLAAVSDVGREGSGDPIENVRTIAVAMFDVIVDRPWLGAYAMRNTARQVHSLQLYEKLGEQIMRLGLSPRDCFHATSAIVGFVIGTAADMGQQLPPEVASGDVGRDEYLAGAVHQWRALDPEEYPFIHHIVDEFAGHDDRDQFRAGLDLLLDGLHLSAGR
ncbi:TetR/AcrR family transcriptional regulator [Microbacterium sp. 11MF]|uniref:TetR/AcrR family transcriptional regulator n=1 Tax=Microbacterium sp. 11MF TaxID=1169146 RepID=UPI000362130A|nr:TetR/AcrR family transcriptional regulator [Microbacterium sp. 11MF]